ncbi:hypothetical protein HDU67_004534 [Dinochytrium kinnereticum]|nr:hypothetical protein HDU67_004534 [Dinochytrium kinnereticum]
MAMMGSSRMLPARSYNASPFLPLCAADTRRGKGIYFKGPHSVTLAILIGSFLVLAAVLLIIYLNLRARKEKKGKKDFETSTQKTFRKHAKELGEDFRRGLHSRFGRTRRMDLSQVSSFGCYLGDLHWHGLTSQEDRLLQSYDILVLNPKCEGVDSRVHDRLKPGGRILAQLELTPAIEESGVLANPNTESLRLFLRFIFRILGTAFNTGLFDGVIFADLDAQLLPEVLLRCFVDIFKFLHGCGILVFVQLQSPHFGYPYLTCLDHVSGIVLNNVTVSPSAETRDFFDIPNRFWELMKLSNVQISYRTDFSAVILEILESKEDHSDSVSMSPAQLSRLFKVSQFYRAVPSAISSLGLKNAELNKPVDRPAGILDVMSWPIYQQCRLLWISHLKKRSLISSAFLNETESQLCQSLQTAPLRMADLELPRPDYSDFTDLCNYGAEVQKLLEIGSSTAQHFLSSNPCHEDLAKLRTLQNDLMLRGLLRPFSSFEFQSIMNDFQSISEETLTQSPTSLSNIKADIVHFLSSGHVRIWSSLNSGLVLSQAVSESHLNMSFWSVWDMVREENGHFINIFVSVNHPRPSEAVLHSYLAWRGVGFEQATEAEMILSRDGCSLPRRIVAEIAKSTPAELLDLLHWSSSGSKTPLKTKITEEVERILSFESDSDFERLFGGLRVLEVGHVRGLIEERLEEILQLMKGRYGWEAVKMPGVDELVQLMESTRIVVRSLVTKNDMQGLDDLLENLKLCLDQPILSICSEWLAFSIFAAFKLEAYDEIRMCVNDFNPLPAHEPDQQALMSELYVLGTRCEEFFDLGIHRLSQKLYADRMLLLQSRNPDASSYHPRKLMFMYRPLIHSGPMEVLCGAFNPALAYSGTYYLFLFQFPAMGSVMLRQFVGSLVCIWSVAFILSIVISACSSLYGGFVFMYYSIVYPIYFLGLGIMATIYSDDMPIASGRRIAWISVPFVLIYWCLAYIGNSKDYQMLIHSAFWGVMAIICIYVFTKYLRRLGGWLSEIKQTDCKDVTNWYSAKYPSNSPSESSSMKESFWNEVARRQLEKEVHAFSYPSLLGLIARTDEYVAKLARSFSMTKFLLQWHSRHLDYDLPVPYGLEWNLNVKLAIQEMEKLNKASIVHRPRMFWNNCKWEMTYGLLFFVLLLMDRWIVLLAGGDILGLITIQNPQYGVGQGSAMLFFLISTISVEVIARRIWDSLGEKDGRNACLTDESPLSIRLEERRSRRMQLYRRYLLLLGVGCSFIFSGICVFVWNMSTGWTSVLVFCALSFGYLALVWMTYTKAFCPQNSKSVAMATLIASGLGLIIGIPLHFVDPEYYPEQLGLVISQWVAALLVLRTFRMDLKSSTQNNANSMETEGSRYQFMTGQHRISVDHAPLTEREVQDFVGRSLRRCAVRLPPYSPVGHSVFNLFKEVDSSNHSDSYCTDSSRAVKFLLENWADVSKLQIHLVEENVMASVHGRSLLGLSWKKYDVEGRGFSLIIYVAVPNETGQSLQQLDTIARHPPSIQSICETILHETVETLEKLRHVDAVVSELARDSDVFGTKVEDAPDENKTSCCQSLDIDDIRKTELTTLLASDYDILLRTSEHLVNLSLAIGYLTRDRQTILPPSGSSSDFRFNSNEPEADDKGGEDKRSRPSFSYMMNRAGELFFGLIMGDSQLPRNLASSVRKINAASRWAVVRAFLMVARGFRKVVWASTQRLLCEYFLPFYCVVVEGSQMLNERFLGDGNDILKTLRTTANRQVRRVITKDYIQIHSPLAPETALLSFQSEQKLVYNHYKGILTKQPLSRKQMTATSEYDPDFTLRKKEVWKNLEVKSRVSFSYTPASGEIPTKKENGLLFHARYVYWSPESFEVIEINYTISQLALKITLIFYTETQRKDKIPTSTLQKAICELLPPSESSQPYLDAFSHFRIPGLVENWRVVTTWRKEVMGGASFAFPMVRNVSRSFLQRIPNQRIQGIASSAPVSISMPQILEDMEKSGMLIYPTEILHFHLENPFFFHRRQMLEVSPRGIWGKVLDAVRVRDAHDVLEKRLKLGTSMARTALWKRWSESSDVHGVWARMIDEALLREESVLKPYWFHRDRGDHKSARLHLLNQEPAVLASLHIDPSVSSKCHLAIRLQDLYMMASGGDCNRIPLAPALSDAIVDRRIGPTEAWKERGYVRVLGLATGTWPSSSGGVSNCIRDVVDRLESVQWTILAENAHDLELILPQFQIERNVESLLMLPLWGFDGLEAVHDFTGTLPDVHLSLNLHSTTPQAIRRFISILERIVDSCLARQVPLNIPSPASECTMTVLTKTDLACASAAFVDYYEFFGKCDYGAVWGSEEVWRCWVRLWSGIGQGGVALERPTVDDLRYSMSYFMRTLFCLTIRLPDPMPDVIQTTHHAIGSIYGVVAKLKTGKPLLAWDHGILWREYLGHWSSSESTSPPAVHSLLLTLARLVSTLTLHHADAILPCTRFSNPIWETWRMASGGETFHPKGVARKIEPVVNGIVGIEDFFPDHGAEWKEVEGGFLVVMLSHIVTFKDIKNAILAADVIVNKFGIKGYHLDIYGSTDKTPWYTYECNVLIHVAGLQNHVKIRGFGDSKFVLNSAWLVLNSSIAEGLPLALGEAGLCGQPIVCTEAGGSREVIQVKVSRQRSSNKVGEESESSGVDEIAYLGRSVSPSNPYELAVAQLAVLGVFDDLEELAALRASPPEIEKEAGMKSLGGAVLDAALSPSSRDSQERSAGASDKILRVDSGTMVDMDMIRVPGGDETAQLEAQTVSPNVGGNESEFWVGAQEEETAPKIREWIAQRRFAEISRRILSKKKERRMLGLRLRDHVLEKFSGDR